MSEYMSVILNQVVLMLILICFMCKIISKDGSKQLSNLLMMVISPVVIFVSYQRDFDPAMLKGLLQAFGLSLVGFAVAIAVAYLFLRKTEKYDVVIERFSTIYSNCGFMGIPLVDAMFGSEGVFYLTAVITAFNLIVWTHGVYTFTGAGEKFSFKGLLNALKSPSIIAVPIGLICFLCNLRVPDVVYDALNYISGMNTPLAMIVAGVTVAQTDLKQVFVKGRIYYVSFLKLSSRPCSSCWSMRCSRACPPSSRSLLRLPWRRPRARWAPCLPSAMTEARCMPRRSLRRPPYSPP